MRYAGVSVPSADVKPPSPLPQFWLLAGFLIVVFLTGGSSKPDVSTLQWLRPVAIGIAAYGLFSINREQWRHYRHLLFFAAAVVLLVVAHSIALPPQVWQQLPGRGIITDIDALAGLRDQWRPLSMVPWGTTNALYALSVPMGVLCLAIQLSPVDHVRLLTLLIVLIIASGALGILQAIGLDVAFYNSDGEIAGLFANRNHQAVLLAALFPMLVVLAAVGPNIGMVGKSGVIVAAGLAVINIPLIIVTGSRAGLLGALLAAMLVPLIGLSITKARKQPSVWLNAGKIGLPAIVAGALVWLTIFASRETALARLQSAEDDIRYPVWSSIVDMLHVYMPWGSGVGTYAEVYQILEPDNLLRATFSNHAHNEWLEIALTAGVPGIVLVIWAVALFLGALPRGFRATGLQGLFSRLGLALLLLLAFASTFDYPVRTPLVASVLTIAAVWAASSRKFGNEDGRR